MNNFADKLSIHSDDDFNARLHTIRQAVVKAHPVVHHITNFVTIYQCALITAFFGAAPIMAFARDDAPSVTARADALVINTGTLNDEFIHAIPKSLTIAEKSGIPVVLDPVGTGLSDYRAHFVSELLSHYHIDVLRCNSAELFSLCGRSAQARGIDGALDTLDPPEITSVVMEAAQKYGCTIACTGAVDYISDGSKTLKLSRGSSLLPKLVGTGCTVNSLIGACLPVCQTPADAAAAGILAMCLASESAQARLEHPGQLGSFETYLLDSIASL